MTEAPLLEIYLHNYLTLLGVVILYYDHALTFGDEYKRIWQHPTRSPSLLFFLNRYFALLTNIVVTSGNFSSFHSDKYAFYRQIALIVSQCIVAFNQFLRTYALYERSRRIGALIIGVTLVLGAASIAAVFDQKSEVIRTQGCHVASSRISAIRLAVAWESLFLFDLLIFTLTFYKSYRERFRYQPRAGQTDLLSLIMRDGAIYFAVMACAQCANTMTFYLLAPVLRGVLSTLASNISVTMMSRLMLNLHHKAAYGYLETTTEVGYAKSTNVVFRVQLAAAGSRTTLITGGEGSTVSSGSARPHDGSTEEYELHAIGS